MNKKNLTFFKSVIKFAILFIILSVIFFAQALPEQAPPTPAPPKPVAVSADQARASHVPILLYHLVSNQGVYTSVTAKAFEAQMRLLRDEGYQSISIDELLAAAEGRAALPEQPVVITFDDGWRCQYSVAAPILARYGLHATFYLVTDVIGAGRAFLSWDECRELVAAGHGIGSHCVDHPRLPHLTPEAQERELVASKRDLEEALGIEVTTLAYPYGSYDDTTIRLAREAGYLNAVAVQRIRRKPTPCFELQRIPVIHGETLEQFQARLHANFRTLEAGPAGGLGRSLPLGTPGRQRCPGAAQDGGAHPPPALALGPGTVPSVAGAARLGP